MEKKFKNIFFIYTYKYSNFQELNVIILFIKINVLINNF